MTTTTTITRQFGDQEVTIALDLTWESTGPDMGFFTGGDIVIRSRTRDDDGWCDGIGYDGKNLSECGMKALIEFASCPIGINVAQMLTQYHDAWREAEAQRVTADAVAKMDAADAWDLAAANDGPHGRIS